jgi:hypothetical protein
MEQTYLCKFDSQGKRTETLLSCEFTEEEKAGKIAEGYIETSQEDWEYYVGNKGNGANGTGYIRGADGKPTDAPAYVPSKEEKLAQLDSQYDRDKAELTKYYTDALLADDAETQEELKAELQELDADYAEQRKAIEEED